MKKAFTMIELIFVIVIIGVLTAVALPKLTAIFGQAKISKIVAYAGTLQRTTIPPYWSESIMSGNGGDISGDAADGVAYAQKIANDLDWPTDFGTTAPLFGSKLLDANSTAIKDGTAPGASGTLASATINNITYSLACTNGTKLKAPICDVHDGSKWILKNDR